ncbi:GNAT family N-acetyltransferase [Planctellipticum variicoloris]|uniref:GNAT family N-acetyltransferase n=1 Tax=Planctellipticum variicoloris TaxID=3064265 RepID=UPI0030137C08|nr:GNAT family N-acetyltransferase [Planctomycetaceae bacterium SH412]
MMSDWRTNQGGGTAVLERRSAPAERSWSAVVEEEIWSSVDEIDVAAWEQVRDPSDLFLDLRLLQAVETSMAATCRFRYVLYRDAAGEPAAIAVLCTFTIDIGVLADDAWSRWALRGLRRISRKLVDYRILFCGLPLSACQSSLRFAPGADSQIILQRLDVALRRFAKQDRASVIVLKEFADEELPPLKPLETLGYRKADSLPTHLVALHSDSFDGFLKDMNSKRRANVRMSLKKFAGKGVEFVTTSDYATIERLFTPETYRLYEEVLGRSETKLEHLPQELFLEMARQLPDCCEFTFAVEGERVIAFCISLWNDHEYRGLFIGYDASRNQDLDLYFNLAFRTIAEAAFHRSAVVEIGQNSSYFKRTKLGAVQSRRSLYVRGGNAVMNGVIGLLFKQLFPPRPLDGAGEGQ